MPGCKLLLPSVTSFPLHSDNFEVLNAAASLSSSSCHISFKASSLICSGMSNISEVSTWTAWLLVSAIKDYFSSVFYSCLHLCCVKSCWGCFQYFHFSFGILTHTSFFLARNFMYLSCIRIFFWWSFSCLSVFLKWFRDLFFGTYCTSWAGIFILSFLPISHSAGLEP